LSKSSRLPKGGGSIRKRADGRWEGRYSMGFNPETGKQIQRSIYGKTKSEVRQKLSKITCEIDEGTYIEPCKMTVEEWLKTWQENYLNDIRDSTKLIYRKTIGNHLNPAFGKYRLDKLDSHTIQLFYNRLLSGTEGKKPLSAKSIKDIHGILHSALSQAVKLGYIRSNPTEACVIPRRQKPDIYPLTEAQMKEFLNKASGSRYELMYHVYLFTGMREAELIGLQWDCVDFERGTIRIDKQLIRSQEKGGQYHFSVPKNGKSRILTPAPYVMSVLEQQRELQNKQREAAGEAWSDTNLVFTNEIGKNISHRALYDHFKRITKSIGLENTRVHDLRHTYAVNSLLAGDNVKTVSANLGHATVAFTLDIYAHYTEDLRKESSEKMENFISRLSDITLPVVSSKVS